MDFFHKNLAEFCNVLKHKGQILKNAIYRYCDMQGMSLTALAKKAGYDQSTPYRHFEKEDLQNHIILRWGKAMGYDFRKEFPELEEDWDMVKDTDRASYPDKPTGEECEKQVEYWRKKYVDLLELHNQLLMEKVKNHS